MKYPKDYLDEIKLRVKVSQVVSKSVQLKKRGKEFIGLSPFKNEKTPSFTVSDEKGFYHCFSSGEHGNIFDFLMKTKSIGFGEAVRMLAMEAGMQPYKFSNFDEKREKRFKVYKSIFKEYLNFFKRQLFDSENIIALNYLSKRGLKKNIIEEFELGYINPRNDFYKKLLENYTEEEIGLTGLFYKLEKSGKFVNRFNSRIIFPIKNLNGEVIAFGGRIIKDGKLAKYINSPETEFYKKGRTIFNLDKVKSFRSETDEIIIVEGYMDVISLYIAGIKNVVSNSGIALTENQIDLIWKFFSKPIVCLDGDESGQRAAIRIAERLIPLINENNKIYFSILPSGNDPDDIIKSGGKEKFLNLLDTKKIIQSYIWGVYSNEMEKEDPFAISKFEKRLKNLCSTIQDSTLRKYILEDFLKRIDVLTPIQNRKRTFNKYSNRNIRVLNETKKLYEQKDHFSKEQIKEHSIFFIMLNYPSVAKSKLDELSRLTFSSDDYNKLKNVLIKLITSNTNEEQIKIEINKNFGNLVKEVEKNSTLKTIIVNKEDSERLELFEEILSDLKEMNHLKKIEFLESKVAKNLDETSYSELIKLKTQLNRD
tara:strand:+ start:518 stop:2296 length:1779 start_codon:yes stop_codon:yes gene_type:complete